MMIIDKILEWARERGYTAIYGSAEQVNEMLTDVPFSDSKDGTAFVMHLITDSATVDGKDTAVVAVYFASLCDFDFDGESLLSEQERLKGIGKDLLNDIRTGNEMTYADPRWQYGYDDYAENVCWVCLRVTLTASAADCVPLVIPKPPAPAADYLYFEAAESNSTVSMMSMLPTAPDLEYSTDGETWQEWQHTTAEGTHTFDTITLTAVGDRVYLRGDNPDGLGFLTEGEEPNFSNFVMTGKINAGGNIMSLLDTTMELTEVPQLGFMGLFAVIGEGQYSALLTHPSMDTITTIGYGGCSEMYYGCTSLTAAAEMPALTTIGEGGCAGMYYGCTSLTAAAEMPALTTIDENGCDDMYGECTFNMSNDGETLNFDFPEPPVTAGTTTYSTAYDIAEWMGNTNGF